jgi:hypothetical protein
MGSAARAQLLGDPSFESDPIGTQIGQTLLFTSTGEWTIDLGFIAGAENGITPFDGDQMLRLDGGSHSSTDIYQLIDVTPFADAIASQQAVADFSAYFNNAAAHNVRVGFVVFEENSLPLDINTQSDGFTSTETFTTDADLATWERVSGQFLIPLNTSFLGVSINSVSDGTLSYADLASLSITTESLVGDVNLDGFVNRFDVDAMSQKLIEGSTESRLDLNGDEMVNGADGVFLVEDILGALTADFDFDGQVGVPDLIVWAQGFGVSDALFTQGDSDFNQQVGVPDLINWAQLFGQTSGPVPITQSQVSGAVAIPEPGGLMLLGIGAVIGWRRRRVVR